MTSIHPTLFYLLIESTLVLLILGASCGFIFFRKHLKKKEALSQLVDTLTHNTEQRKEELLSQLYPEQPEEISPANAASRDEIFRQETELYRYMLGLLTSEDPKIILELDKNIEAFTNAIISSYRDQLESKENKVNSGEKKNDSDISTELSQIRNDLIALNEKNDLLLATLNGLTLHSTEKEPREAPQKTDIQTPSTDEVDGPSDENITAAEEETDAATEEPSPPSENENIIDISEDDETTHKTETPATSTNTDEKSSDDEGIEEIPDDLLQQDELSVNDAATDIDALFAEVANENIEKSAAP